jgi:hypothetical protein
MTSKGAVYSKIFRKAGLAWGKGDVAKAVALLQEGLQCATANGDADVARVFQTDLERYQRLLQGESIRLSD